jgi:hypothetical protein
MHLDNIIPKNPCDVVFWTGAGISLDSPSSLPSGYSLTEDVVNTYCINNTWSTICRYLKKARLEDASGNVKSIPRLESILGNVVSVLGFDILNHFSFLDAPPNFFHHFFSHHILAGGNHITLNLDLCIENAINHFIPSLRYEVITPDNVPANISGYTKDGWLLHLHGKFGSDLANLGLTIENVTKGINDKISQLIIEAINSKRVIVFLEYSGSDVFDVNPFFEKLKHYSLFFEFLFYF